MESLSNDEANWFIAFLRAKDWTSSRLLVETHPELLSSGVDDALTRILSDMAEELLSEAFRHVVLWRRDLLRLCRASGITVAYTRYAEQEYLLLPSPFEQLIIDTTLEFINASSWEERKHIVEAHHDQLFTDAADVYFTSVLASYKNDADLARHIEECQALLAQCRSEGIDAAFSHHLRLESLLQEIGLLNRLQDLPRKSALIEEALTLVKSEQDPWQWASLHRTFARSILDHPDAHTAENIEQVIDRMQQVLEVLTRETFPASWAEASSNLGAAYSAHAYGDPAQNAELGIGYMQAALEVYTQKDYPEGWAGTEYNLGQAYPKRILGDQAENLDQAIIHYQRALEFYTLEHFPDRWAMIQFNLAEAYKKSTLYHEEKAERLEKAIAHYQQTLKVYTWENSPEEWARVQCFLANIYLNAFKFKNANAMTMSPITLLEQSISHEQLALKVYTREKHPQEWADAHQDLGLAYSDLDRGARSDNIRQAIKHYKFALEVRTREDSPEEWARLQHNLSRAYYDYGGGDRAENLEQTIAYGKRALEVRTKQAFPEKYAMTHDILGLAYKDRIYGEQADNLEQAVAHFQMALEVYTREAFPRDRARVHNNLGTAYLKRGSQLVVENERVFDNLEMAIQHFEWALEVRTRQDYPFNWAQTELNLGNAYLNLVSEIREENIEKAIHHFEQALEVLTQRDYSFLWTVARRSLAQAYDHRASGERVDNLERAITNLHLAAEVLTYEDYPYFWAIINRDLGGFYLEQMKVDGIDYLDQALSYYHKALEVFSPATFPAERRKTLSDLGNAYFYLQRWTDARSVYEEAIEAGEALIATAYTETGRKEEIGKISELYTNIAYCLLKLGEPEKAFILLEQGKARLLARALMLTETDLTTLSEIQRQAIVEVRKTLRELEAEQRSPLDTPYRRPNAELGQVLQQAYVKLNQIINTIRADNPDFMRIDITLSDILALIPKDGALVVPIITSQGGMVYILPYGLEHITYEHIITLDSLNTRTLSQLVVGKRNEPGWAFIYADWETDKKTLYDWMAAIDTFTSQLWEMLMGPIHDRLTSLGLAEEASVIILPQGGLGLLPLHAAWRMVDGTKRAFFDKYTVGYAPSAYSLNMSRRAQQNLVKHERTLLAVINPTADLLYTPIEGNAVAAHFAAAARHVLMGSEATKRAVMEKAAGITYLHFSCHGYCDWTDFMYSRLLLSGHELLTLADIISPQFDLSGTQLVTLSACETGQIDFAYSPNEYIGLATGFLQAGAQAVVSSLWAVADFSTALLMQEFYRRHLAEGRNVVEALRGAQLWLRQATAREVKLAENWEQVYQASGQTDAGAFLAMRYYYARPDDRPFSHPYYWAAFTYNGG